MKKIVAFFARLFAWVINLFKSKPEIVPEETSAEVIQKKIVPEEKTIGSRRNYPAHNNRKNTNGRFVQYVVFGNTTKPIYHGAK